LEREEGAVHFAGFSGGDRTTLDLPAVQEHLLEQVTAAAAGKPVVLVLANGSALSVDWAAEHVPAILESWYPGQHGDAVADILFGNYNPAGRLPVTFYKSVTDLPDFSDYSMQAAPAGRTYRYFTREPLFPFGYGLSYTTFEYSNLQIYPNPSTSSGVTASVSVKNTGSVAGDEVVQLYLDRPKATDQPHKALVGFLRVPLQAGESKTVEFTVTPQQLSTVDESGKRMVQPETITLQAGGSSANGLMREVTLGGEAAAPEYRMVAPTAK
jgi:beta-glucosidase